VTVIRQANPVGWRHDERLAMSNTTAARTRGPVTRTAGVRLTAGIGLAAGVALVAAACSSGASTSGTTVITTATSSAGRFLTSGSGRAVYLHPADG
jgi:hypothetical protein